MTKVRGMLAGSNPSPTVPDLCREFQLFNTGKGAAATR
jgi:hypothetical protein